MAQVIATMRTLDLRGAAHTPVTGLHVWKLQAMLNVWLHSADTPAEEEPPALLATDAIGGPLTQKVLIEFQSAAGLDVDAIAGALTWKSLLEFDGNLRG